MLNKQAFEARTNYMYCTPSVSTLANHTAALCFDWLRQNDLLLLLLLLCVIF